LRQESSEKLDKIYRNTVSISVFYLNHNCSYYSITITSKRLLQYWTAVLKNRNYSKKQHYSTTACSNNNITGFAMGYGYSALASCEKLVHFIATRQSLKLNKLKLRHVRSRGHTQCVFPCQVFDNIFKHCGTALKKKTNCWRAAE